MKRYDACVYCCDMKESVDGAYVEYSEAQARIAELGAENARLRELTEWRPIETAPKDDPFLALVRYGKSQQVYLMRWTAAEAKNNRDVGGRFVLERVTHWLPLPEAPKWEA